ncbi:MAG: GTPase HflX [Desulfovibrionaceae bacterium]|nr:GTPase HflX [Desulfovibrionaceae bacterium]
MDLLFLRLDFLSVLQADKNGAPVSFQYSYLMPAPEKDAPYYISPVLAPDRVDLNLKAQIEALEQEMGARQSEFKSPANSRSPRPKRRRLQAEEEKNSASMPCSSAPGDNTAPSSVMEQPYDRAILVSVSKSPRKIQERFMAELVDLAASAGVEACEQVFYRPSEGYGKAGRMLLGEGRLAELEVLALKNRADMLIFDGELTSAQIDHLTRISERKVLDRTMLILDIFAQRASSNAGKLQVELAQLEYALPRLAGRNAGRAMDRLAGGIGGRGPGETKLELDRRRIRDRMAKVKQEIKNLSNQRELVRNRREQAGLPVICLVGYTNTGKSTLLNKLTQSEVYAENQLFATLDSTARRLFVPVPHPLGEPGIRLAHMGFHEAESSACPALPSQPPALQEAIITDTVGFIRDLPAPLRAAFTATLEELEAASLFLHVADASHPDLDLQIESVQKILTELGLESIPSLLVMNKWDLLSSAETDFEQTAEEDKNADRMLAILKRYPHCVPISAAQGLGLDFLKQKIGLLLAAAEIS